MQALEAFADSPAPAGAWELTSYRGNGQVTVRRGDGAPRPCEPRLPAELEPGCPDDLSRRWLGERLHAVCTHMPQHNYEREASGSDDGGGARCAEQRCWFSTAQQRCDCVPFRTSSTLRTVLLAACTRSIHSHTAAP